MRIAIVDDLGTERTLLKERLVRQLSQRGADAELLEFDSGEAFLAAEKEQRFTAAFLDIYMNGLSGMDAARELRKTDADCLLVFTTTSTDHALEGFQVRAFHYLVKPFSFDELLARIRAMTRKSTGSVTNVFTCGDLSLDAASHRVTRAGKSIDLSAKEFAVLEFMIRNKGSVLSREAIENNVWSYDWEGGTNVVDVYMSYLRRKLDADFDKKLIHTVRGVGWVLRDEA